MASNGYVQFDPAVIEQARQIDLLSYLQRYERASERASKHRLLGTKGRLSGGNPLKPLIRKDLI